MNGYFYDIESLENVFTLANLREKDNTIEIYYLCDDAFLAPKGFETACTKRIHEKNKNFDGNVEYYPLTDPESTYRLARTFGLSDAKYLNNPDNKSSYDDSYRLVCDTDTDYDENIHPYLFGYNSFNYDTTVLAWYLYNAVDDKTGDFYPQTALSIRAFNDELFSDEFKERMPDRLRYSYKNPARPALGYSSPNFSQPAALIRKNMMMSGRHIDVSKLNEKQSKVGLKRLLGMIGYQILESDKLRPGQNRIESSDQFLDLVAYNVSDVVNLKKLFEHKTYQSNFSLKKQLLLDYPDLIYAEKDHTYKPDISPKSVRNDRLTIDSSSAQFATKALCPYGHLHDYDTVSFDYPSEAKAKALGIPRINVLEESKKFFHSHFTQPEILEKFDAIYDYYKAIEGRNFNTSKNYLIDHDVEVDAYDPTDQLPAELRPIKFIDIPAPNTFLFYYNKDGTPSSCFVNFSTGGIHGAEYNKELYEYDLEQHKIAMQEWQAKVDLFNEVKKIYPNPCDLKAAKGVTINDVKYTPSTFLKPKATTTEAYYKDPPEPPKKPVLFVQNKSAATGSDTYGLAKRYAYTSAALTNHEDFTSYYPNLLRQMDAFFNTGLGYDRYGEIFDNKTKFGKLMKDESLSQAERDKYAIMREGTKLVLNSASGAADANFESNIRMNNKIISMRIIGQLFTWRIGQAQTIEGASMISTNTDGLYSVLEAEFNNKILARESANINVEIEPEPIYLISKDTNNRAEIKIKDGQLGDVASASGGTLACRKGPNPTKSLAHPAIIDWALTEYLTIASIGYKGLSLEKPFDDTIGMNILKSARTAFNDDVQTLLMFQNIIASSPGSIRYIFATRDGSDEAIPLQHYNRCFVVKDKTPGSYHLQAAFAKVITDAMQKKRAKNNERPQQHDPVAASILAVNGVKTSELPMNKEAVINKITGVEETWYITINNNDLHLMSDDDKNALLDSLDYDKYLSMFRDSFENSWRNLTPEYINKSKDAKSEEETSVQPLNADVPTEMPATLVETVDGARNDVDTSPKGISTEDLPVMYQLKKTLLSDVDIKNGEHILCMNGIREADAHNLMKKLLKAITDTDIN